MPSKVNVKNDNSEKKWNKYHGDNWYRWAEVVVTCQKPAYKNHSCSQCDLMHRSNQQTSDGNVYHCYINDLHLWYTEKKTSHTACWSRSSYLATTFRANRNSSQNIQGSTQLYTVPHRHYSMIQCEFLDYTMYSENATEPESWPSYNSKPDVNPKLFSLCLE